MHLDIEQQYEKIYRYCYFRVKHVQKAEDITQETFLRFFGSSYRDAGRPLAYLYTIARNLCIDAFREREMLPLEEALAEKGFENRVRGFENRIVDNLALAEAMQALTEEEQELLLLRYVNELPFGVLCEMYHESRFALYRRLSKITKKLEGRLLDEPKNQENA